MGEAGDDQIEQDWEQCAQCCRDYLCKELETISAVVEKLAMIVFGNYALAMSRYILENIHLPKKPGGIMNYIKLHDPTKPFQFSGIPIYLFPLIHPANQDRVLKRWDKCGSVAAKEAAFIRKIRQF